MKIVNDIEFVNDEKAIGKWELIDIVNSIDEFNTTKKADLSKNQGFKEIYFLPEGKGYWIFEGWTKGFLVVHLGGDDPIIYYNYTIKDIMNNSYMFIEVKNDEEDYIKVMKKVSSKHFKLSDFVIKENINIPFVSDEKIIGTWKTVGYVEKIEQFTGEKNPNQTLWLEKIVFNLDGTAYRKYFDTKWHDKWSKGVLLDLKKSVVSHYSFKTISGVEYMFLEWKMGNYIYAGMPPTYYVFIKTND